MTSSEIRQSFLDFFKSKRHTIVPSSSLLPDSPNLLFTNAGMNQFVPIFLGQQKPDVDKWPGAIPGLPTRAADTQKCIRAGGKHNDLDDVGLDTYHHTFFEMLGNWSFGDYFKKEAIDWAWELITEVWKFPKERLYTTVFCPHMDMKLWKDELDGAIHSAQTRLDGGISVYAHAKDSSATSRSDDEAASFWAWHFLKAGLDPLEHIIPGNKKDNFWMMGETGPCGPCSEIHVDLTPKGDTKGALVNQGSADCIEIWNLVFIQFNANPDGTFSPLPARHVDTGMGFERVTGILQCTKKFTDFIGTISNYETDIFRPLFDKLEKLSGKKYASTLPGSASLPGSAGVPPAPVGVSPTGSSASIKQNTPGISRAPESAARDARQSDRDGRGPRTETPPGAVYYKRRLPHFERPWAKYMVSFSTREHRQLSPQARDIVLKSVLYGHEQRRYQLYAACVMPDHVHMLLEPQIKEQDSEGKPVFWSLSDLFHSIKSFTAHEINKREVTSGQVWENESFDRMIRGDADLEEKFHYICRNPWDSGIVSPAEPYPWLWTPDVPVAGKMGSAGVPPAPAGVSPTGSSALTKQNAPGTSGALESAARDARQSDRDGRAPQTEQIQIDIAFRVIADHIRTLSFAIADGILPGNTDRNYVLRRILRRAVRYGRALGFHEPFFYKLVDVLVETMGHVFPEIREKRQNVQEVIRVEEEAFNKTLDNGVRIFENEASNYPPEDNDQFSKGCISGETAFLLYDTYGFPLDLTELMARERGLAVDIPSFNKLMDEQRARARAAQKKEVISLSQIETITPTKFIGFEKLETPAKVLEVVSVKDKTAVILDTSTAYAEMGGQVGDTGELVGGGQLWRIVNTQKTGNTFMHFLAEKDAPAVGTEVQLSVDAHRRNAIQRHHTVTHLLHWALHEVVSKEAAQKGSYVGPEKLTFDFNSAALTPQQVADVEKMVNERIVENAGVFWTEVPYSQVKSRKDIMQFFGDKYGDRVRVVQIGGDAEKLNGYSMELCGGTHTRATGEIGLFRVVGESAIAAGVRRIEAVAGLTAYQKTRQEAELINAMAGRVNAPVGELEKKIEALLAQQKELEKSLRTANQREASNQAKSLLAQATTSNGIPSIIANVPGADGEQLQTIADALKSQFKGVVVLGGSTGGAVSLVAAVSPEFTSKVQAGKIIQAIAPIVCGKGGGKPDNARGGGKDVSKLDEALTKARSLLA